MFTKICSYHVYLYDLTLDGDYSFQTKLPSKPRKKQIRGRDLIKNVAPEDRKRCRECGDAFANQHALTQHMAKKHRLTAGHVCGFCGQRFYHKHQFMSHESIHTGVNPYKCTKCSKTFRHSSNLHAHMKTCGMGAGELACDECPKKFKVMKYLTDHKKYSHGHGNPEKFVCSKCGNKYRHRASLLKHVKNRDLHMTDN